MQSGNIYIDNEIFNFELNDFNLVISLNNEYWIKEVNNKILSASLFPIQNKLIFFKEAGFNTIGNISCNNVDMIIEYNDDNIEKIKKIQFELNELDLMYASSKKIISMDLDVTKSSTKKYLVPSFENLNSKKYELIIDNKVITYGIEVQYVYNNSPSTPLSFNYYFSVECDFDTNYELIFKTINYVKNFFSFLSFRKNIHFKSIIINSLNEENKFYPIGNMKYNNFLYPNKVEESYLRDKYIFFDEICENISVIFQNIVEKKIGLRYIPKSDFNIKIYDPERIIMITSTFEFQFKEQFNDKIEHSSAKINLRQQISDILENSKNDFNSSGKRELGRLINVLHYDNFGAKVNEVLKSKKYNGVYIENKIKKFYKLHNIAFVKSNFTEQIEKIRNNIAHYKIEEKTSQSKLICIQSLELINYILQLKYCHVTEENIDKILYRLFRI